MTHGVILDDNTLFRKLGPSVGSSPMAQWFRMLMATSALIGATMATQAAPPHGGTFNFARNADSQFLDPALNDANVDIWILTNLYSGLLAPQPDGLGVRPGLASEWSTSADGKT